MSSRSLPPTVAAGDRADISIRDAGLTWLAAYIVGGLLSSIVSGGHSASEITPAHLLAAWAAQWGPMIWAIWWVGKRCGCGLLSEDYGYTFRPIDLIGVPVGVFTQLVLLRLVYLPLEAFWPHTFAQDKLEERAKSIVDNAHGGGMLLVILVVVIGAPLVEELTYRGLLQGAFTRRLSDGVGVVIVAMWFALIHFAPVEIPGLFVVGLVLGVCAVRTGRLGLGVITHLAFNATGLILAVTS